MNRFSKLIMYIGAGVALCGFMLPFFGVDVPGQPYNVLQVGGVALVIVFGLIYRLTAPPPEEGGR